LPTATRATRVPQEILTDAVIEEVKTRCCFVGDALESSHEVRLASPSADDSGEFHLPLTSDRAPSESEFSQPSRPDSFQSSRHTSSEFSAASAPRVVNAEHQRSEGPLQALATLYTRHSTATEIQMRVVPPESQQTGTGRGTLIIPGWIRERAAEVLFEGGDVDESSVAEVILEALLKVNCLVPSTCLVIYSI
jgi:actin-related protein 10